MAKLPGLTRCQPARARAVRAAEAFPKPGPANGFPSRGARGGGGGGAWGVTEDCAPLTAGPPLSPPPSRSLSRAHGSRQGAGVCRAVGSVELWGR